MDNLRAFFIATLFAYTIEYEGRIILNYGDKISMFIVYFFTYGLMWWGRSIDDGHSPSNFEDHYSVPLTRNLWQHLPRTTLSSVTLNTKPLIYRVRQTSWLLHISRHTGETIVREPTSLSPMRGRMVSTKTS